MGTEKVIEISNFHITDDERSLAILSTYNKLKKYEGKKNIDLLINTNILSINDIKNITKAYSAATIYASLDMFKNEKRIVALLDIEKLVGSYNFTKDMYRIFIYAYEAVKYINTESIKIDVKEEPQFKLA